MTVDSYLAKLYREGRQNDASASVRSSMMFNITPSTGAFLDLIVSEQRPSRILELGTSNGYSTIWLARAARQVGARIDTVDISPQKTHLAHENLAKCGLQDDVVIHLGNCSEFLRDCDSDTYDLVFLDSDRASYVQWADDLVRVIRFGVLVVDNATSHPEEMLDFKRYLSVSLGLAIVVLPIGNGQMLVQSDRE